jgi:hypothetical protein
MQKAIGKRPKHATGGIPRWSPTLVLVARFSAHVWQSGRNARFSLPLNLEPQFPPTVNSGANVILKLPARAQEPAQTERFLDSEARDIQTDSKWEKSSDCKTESIRLKIARDLERERKLGRGVRKDW